MSVHDDQSKVRKSLKSKSVQPRLQYKAIFVVVQRKGCTVIGGSKSMIFDINKELW